MKSFLKKGGVFLFDESNQDSELSYYELEDLMNEEEGKDITDVCVDEKERLFIFYDANILNEREAIEKFKSGKYLTYIRRG